MIEPSDDESQKWTCGGCGKVMRDYAEVGYDGAAHGGVAIATEECSPFMEWLVLCRECADQDPVVSSMPE